MKEANQLQSYHQFRIFLKQKMGKPTEKSLDQKRQLLGQLE